MGDYLDNLSSDGADHSVHNGVVLRIALYGDFHDNMADHNDGSHDKSRCLVRYLGVASSMGLVLVHSLNFRTSHT